MEVDISKKVNNVLKFWLPVLVLVAMICAGGIWFLLQRNDVLTIHDAQISCTMVNAKTKAAGTIDEILVEEGDHVEAGDVIARVKVDITEDQIHQLEQTVELAQKNLTTIKAGTTVTTPVVNGGGGGGAAAQAELERASSNLERMNRLYEMGAVSAVRRDAAASEYAAAQAAVNAGSASSVNYQSVVQPSSPEAIKNAELQVKQAQAALDAAKQDAGATVITAPVAGTVFYTDVQAGTKVKAGQTVINIGDSGNLWLEAHIKPEQKTKVSLGQFASYTIETRKLQGTVFDIKDPADNQDASDANTEGTADEDSRITIKVSLPSNTGLTLKPGTKAVLQLTVK